VLVERVGAIGHNTLVICRKNVVELTTTVNPGDSNSRHEVLPLPPKAVVGRCRKPEDVCARPSADCTGCEWRPSALPASFYAEEAAVPGFLTHRLCPILVGQLHGSTPR